MLGAYYDTPAPGPTQGSSTRSSQKASSQRSSTTAPAYIANEQALGLHVLSPPTPPSPGTTSRSPRSPSSYGYRQGSHHHRQTSPNPNTKYNNDDTYNTTYTSDNNNNYYSSSKKHYGVGDTTYNMTMTTTATSVYGHLNETPLPPQTLDDVRSQVAMEWAIKAVMKAEVVDGVKIGVIESDGDSLGGSGSSNQEDQEEDTPWHAASSKDDNHGDEDALMLRGEQSVFLRRIAEYIKQRMLLSTQAYLFILADTTSSCPPSKGKKRRRQGFKNVLYILGSSEDLVQRSALLASSKFVGRIIVPSPSSQLPGSFSSSSSQFPNDNAPPLYATLIDNLSSSSPYDLSALHDITRKAARAPIDPLLPPPGSQSIDLMLETARARLQRLSANQAYRALQDSLLAASSGTALSGTGTGTGTGMAGGGGAPPVFLVDIRPREQRVKHGGIRGSLVIERNVLEWRLDPRCDSRLAIADRYDLVVVVFCQEGYASSLAAYSLQQLGLLNATDIIGGYEAWRLAGLPIDTDDRAFQERSLVSRAGSVV